MALQEHWGRLVALLVGQYRRLDLAEDGLGDAYEAAARRWPVDGEPTNPPAWLLTAARRRIVDRLRAEAVADRAMPLLAVEEDRREPTATTADGSRGRREDVAARDELLRLVLLCTHPVLAPDAAAALALRMVLGVSTADIARLFLVPTPTMAARLTRARKRLATASLAVPVGDELLARLRTVADVAYLAFTAGYAPGSGSDVVRVGTSGEALRLVRVVRDLVPVALAAEADLDALLALLLLQHARRDARVEEGRPVLLPDQDRSRWHHDEITEALGLLTPLISGPDPSTTPRLLEALIAAQHAVASTAYDTDWVRIAGYYAALERLTASPVVRLNRAVAVAEADGPDAGLRLLESLELPGHRLPAVRAELLARAGRTEQARASYDEAVAACENEAEVAHLVVRRDALAGSGSPGGPAVSP